MRNQFPKNALAYLRSHGLSGSTRKLGLRYFTEEQTKDQVGLPEDGLPSDGLGIPLRRKSADGDTQYNIRFLREGAKPKFKAAFGSRNEFFLLGLHDWDAIKKDTSVEVWMVEGWNTAGMLTDVAGGFPAIGINGVYGWMSKGRDIVRYKRSGFRWRDRTVRLCFDSDVLWNPKVQEAIVRLYRLLVELRAKPKITVIPSSREQKLGPADFVLQKLAKGYIGITALKALPTIALGEGPSYEWESPPVVRRLNDKLAITKVKSQAMVLHTAPDAKNPRLLETTIMRPHEVRMLYAPDRVTIQDKDGKDKQVAAFDLWFNSPHRRVVTDMALDASRPFGYDPLTQQFNTWQGFAFEPHESDETHGWQLFKNHLLQIVASGQQEHYEYLLKSLGWWVQYPTDRSGVAIALIGEEGAGKGFVFTHFGKLFGKHYIALYDVEHLLGKFTGHLDGKVAVFLDEAIFAGDRRQRDKLYHLITEETVVQEAKGKDAVEVRNDRKYAMATNHDWAVPAGLKARRFFVLKVSDEKCSDFEYFGAIADELKNGGYAAMLYELQQMDLSDFEIRKVPKTTALLHQKLRSLGPLEEWYYNCLRTGSLEPGHTKWSGRTTNDQIIASVKDLVTSKHEEKSARMQIGHTLKKLCPPMQRKKQRRSGRKIYRFPALDRCRKEFDKYIGQPVGWGK